MASLGGLTRATSPVHAYIAAFHNSYEKILRSKLGSLSLPNVFLENKCSLAYCVLIPVHGGPDEARQCP